MGSELCSDATELPSVISESLRKLALVGVLPCGLFKKMLQQILPVLALGVSFFFIIPREENCLLVLLQLNRPQLSQAEINALGNMKHAFIIERNIDGHMDHVDISGKEKYNFALVTNHFSSEAESLKFGDTLKRIKSIDNFQVFSFTSSTRVPVMNMIIFLKKQLFDWAPSLARTFPSLDLTLTPIVKENKGEEEEDMGELSLMEELCSEQEVLKHKGSHPIINIVKVKDKEVLDKYNNPTIFQFFPATNTRILLVGKPRSEYWDAVAIMEYTDRAGFCRMVLSEEWTSVLKYKIAGLADTHTYLASPLPLV